MLNTHTSCSSTIYITNGEPKMKFVVAVVRQATCSRRKFGFKQAIWKKKMQMIKHIGLCLIITKSMCGKIL